MIAIENGRVKGTRFVRANASGGAMAPPKYVVLHDTASRIDHGNVVKYFSGNDCKVSAHFVVERDGTVTQMVETNRKAFHAGVSKWKGQNGLNSSSIGIEIVNPGKMDPSGKAWFGIGAKVSELVHKSTPEHGDGWWLPYTEAQIASVKLLCTLIVDEYPDCNEILTHWQISPGRKIDTNPLFPLREIRKAVLNPDPEEAAKIEEVVAAPVEAKPSKLKELMVEGAKSTTNQSAFAVFMASIEQYFGLFRSILPEAKEETEAIAAPLDSLGVLLKINLGGIIFALTLIGLAVVIYRNSHRKVELKNLKGE